MSWPLLKYGKENDWSATRDYRQSHRVCDADEFMKLQTQISAQSVGMPNTRYSHHICACLRPVFQVATTREGSGVLLLNEPPDGSPEAQSCFWWRRGRVELPVQKKTAQNILQA
jgi:hypothetical protein